MHLPGFSLLHLGNKRNRKDTEGRRFRPWPVDRAYIVGRHRAELYEYFFSTS